MNDVLSLREELKPWAENLVLERQRLAALFSRSERLETALEQRAQALEQLREHFVADLGARLDVVTQVVQEVRAGMEQALAEELKGTLYLNASCPLVRRLAESPPPEPSRDAVLDLLHQTARLFAGRMLSPADAVQAFRETTRAIEGLLKP